MSLVVDDAASSTTAWALVDTVMVRADVEERDHVVVVSAAIDSADTIEALEALRPRGLRRPQRRVTWEGRSLSAYLKRVERADDDRRAVVTLEKPQYPGMRLDLPGGSVTTVAGAYTPDDRARRSLRRILFGEQMTAEPFGISEMVRDFTVDLPRDVSESVYAAAFRLLATEALIKAGAAVRVTRADVSPAGPDGREVELAWVSTRRTRTESLVTLSGVWRPA